MKQLRVVTVRRIQILERRKVLELALTIFLMFNMIRVKRSETEPKSLLDGFVIKQISYVNSASTDGVFFLIKCTSQKKLF